MRNLGLSWTRLANLVPVLFGITLVSFVLIRLVPGDPATQILGNRYTPEAAEQIRNSLGLNDSILTQYGIFLRSALTGVSEWAPVRGEKLVGRAPGPAGGDEEIKVGVAMRQPSGEPLCRSWCCPVRWV